MTNITIKVDFNTLWITVALLLIGFMFGRLWGMQPCDCEIMDTHPQYEKQMIDDFCYEFLNYHYYVEQYCYWGADSFNDTWIKIGEVE